jgi:hypothetical protein
VTYLIKVIDHEFYDMVIVKTGLSIQEAESLCNDYRKYGYGAMFEQEAE